MDSENAIIQQSTRHPDGWGVAYYHMGSPHLVKNDNQARECKIFEKVSGVVSSNTVVTHIRKSTVGSVGPLNTHPFQYGPWVFVHNGNTENFQAKREELLKKIDPQLSRYILGETDSEALFYYLLTILSKKGILSSFDPQVSFFKDVLHDFVEGFQEVFGPIVESKGDYHRNYLTFLITNGRMMYAFQGGQPLFYSTHKSRCSERETCAHFKPLCEAKASPSDKVHHLLISSEVIKNENEWTSMQFGELVGVNDMFQFHNETLKI